MSQLLFISLADYLPVVALDGILGDVVKLWINILVYTIIATFMISEITRNYSQVDKIWSLLPIVYSIIVMINFPSSERIMLMTTLVTLWGLRLSYNFYRKGGYHMIPWKGEEDYRWSILRQNPILEKRLRFSLFNLLFISFYQLTLITLFCSPLLLAAYYESVTLNIIDYIATVFMSLFLVTETIADNQLFAFQQQKQMKAPVTGEFDKSLEKGFMIDGLWKYVRHPNFISEQLIWVSFYLFAVAASGEWLNWTIIGAVLLILLFMGSSGFTEGISQKKYPEYVQYKKNVPRFIPAIFKNKINN